ncbi:MAG: hypothetical protein WBA97_34345 [Actinophytocola sp.]|uniref:hypothetical protein n=1 Tax=Actinophytocola sp. TaxID=1872138 RepID=UPI003C77CB83
MSDTGWVCLQGSIVGTVENYSTVYTRSGGLFTSQHSACEAGIKTLGHDDFNVAHVVNGEVVWWGWMEEPHPIDDAAEAAEQFGWSVAEASAVSS